MAQVTKAKAFNPFFTTKEVGKGMGLGLSLSYGILSKVHGSIRIESAEGKGTTFVIRIPKDFREHA
jgi:signal transduction histidine kinase